MVTGNLLGYAGRTGSSPGYRFGVHHNSLPGKASGIDRQISPILESFNTKYHPMDSDKTAVKASNKNGTLTCPRFFILQIAAHSLDGYNFLLYLLSQTLVDSNYDTPSLNHKPVYLKH